MPLVLHDTLRRRKVEFTPADPKRITMYVCGPTVYNYAHIGNARPVVVFDVLYRLLNRLHGPEGTVSQGEVIYARNITDVDDKINAAAIAEGVPIGTITDKFAKIYNADMAALGCVALDEKYQPRATDHILEMVRLIETLLEKKAAYVNEGHVLFEVAKFPAYGELSGRTLQQMIEGHRVEVAPYKLGRGDFVLWKPSKPGEPRWDGPIDPATGKRLEGRPGWHIECSAMSEAVLGLPIDIHGGGHDLIFPHHTNEIAQSCAAHGADDPAAYVRYWMHNGFLDFSGEKMSKSLGNVVLVHDLVKQYPGEVIRWALLSGHYRSPLDWTPELLEQAQATLDGVYQVLRDMPDVPELSEWKAGRKNALKEQFFEYENQLLGDFWSALLDDLNTPLALSQIVSLSRRLRTLIITGNKSDIGRNYSALMVAAGTLGFLQYEAKVWFEGGADADLKAKVEALIAERIAARAAKDFAAADRIRDELTALNIVVMDGPTGATWRLKD